MIALTREEATEILKHLCRIEGVLLLNSTDRINAVGIQEEMDYPVDILTRKLLEEKK